MEDGQEEATVEGLLCELAHEIHTLVGVRMHRLNVCQWEVKLWMTSAGPASGAWRVVVDNVTGQTCTVNVSLYRVSTYFISYSFLADT